MAGILQIPNNRDVKGLAPGPSLTRRTVFQSECDETLPLLTLSKPSDTPPTLQL